MGTEPVRSWSEGGLVLEAGPWTLPSAFREVARRTPDSLAIQADTEAVTFAELERRANRVAQAILTRNVTAGARVASLLGNGVASVEASLGVAGAGCVGLTMDPREPAERLARIHATAEASLVITDVAHREIATRIAENQTVLLMEDAAACEDSTPDVVIEPGSLARLLFTSGSTGDPKAVMMTHAQAVTRALRFPAMVGLEPTDRVMAAGSFSFAAVHSRLFDAMLNGLPVFTYDLPIHGPRGLPAWIRTHRITVAWCVVSVLRAIAESGPHPRMDSVRIVITGGENLYGSDVARARASFPPATQFLNRLGSTEGGPTSGWVVTADDERSDAPVPVGRPWPWIEARIVDDDGVVVDDGEPGRLVVLTDSMSPGYWRDPALTAEKYFTEPDGRLGYVSSDQLRRRADGVLEHLGRLDARVKVRGAMVATSEVERALTAVDGVAEAKVAGVPTSDGGTRLVAYVTPEGNAHLSPWQLRREVAARLPTTMVPNAVVVLDALPRNIRGKVDVNALPPPPPAPPYREPIGYERDLADLFGEVLGLERVGLDDDFFELGGDSLGVVELVAAVHEHFGLDVPASLILDAPTVATLAPRLAHRRNRRAPVVVPLRTEGAGASPFRHGAGTPFRHGAGTPFFCVAGGGAPALSLLALADTLDRPVYGIQARGLEERAIPDHSVVAAARRDVAAVRRLQPGGPYLLGGYSFGSLVAFDMACRLEASGADVPLLVILDTVAPGWVPTRAKRARRRTDALSDGSSDQGWRRRARIAVRGAQFAARSARTHAERRIMLTSAGLFPRRGLQQYELFLRLNSRMTREYSPAHTFNGPALLVRCATESAAGPDPRRAARDLGWSQWVTGEVTVVDAPGDHLDMIRTPAVAAVGAAVRDALARVDR